MQNLRNANASCRFAVESIGSGKLTKQIDRRSNGGGPRSALCNGENHTPKYLPPVYRPHRLMPVHQRKRNEPRTRDHLEESRLRREQRDVPSKFSGSGFGVIDFPHRIAGAQRWIFEGVEERDQRAVSGSRFCGLPVENRWIRPRITVRLINRGWRSLIDNDLH